MKCAVRSLTLTVPLHSRPHLLLVQSVDHVRPYDALTERLLLQQLQVAQRRARVVQVLEVRRARPVLQVGEVGDEGGLGEELLVGEIVEIEGIGKGLDELELELEACVAAVLGLVWGRSWRLGRLGGDVGVHCGVRKGGVGQSGPLRC